jgi:hypothetical protein
MTESNLYLGVRGRQVLVYEDLREDDHWPLHRQYPLHLPVAMAFLEISINSYTVLICMYSSICICIYLCFHYFLCLLK